MSESILNQEINKYINVQSGLDRIRGNKKLFVKMLELFMDSKEFDSLDKCLQKKDFEQAAKEAHAIKGMTGNLSMTVLFEISTKLMLQLRENIFEESTVSEYYDALKNTRLCVKDLITILSSES